jgi:hypothetical protein
MKIYLDIDGVLLTTKNSKVISNAELFIDFLVNSFDCFLISFLKSKKTEIVKNFLQKGW